MTRQRSSNAAFLSLRWFVAAAAMMLAALAIGTMSGITSRGAAAAEDKVFIKLKETHDSGVTATVKLTTEDGATLVRIYVKGADQQYLPYVRRGTCTEYKEIQGIPLSLASPARSTTTTIDIPIDDLRSGDYLIDLHVAAGNLESLNDPKSSVACGLIAAVDPEPTPVDEVATVTEPPVAGVGGFTGGAWVFGAAATMLGLSMLFAVTGLFQRRTAEVVTPVTVSATAVRRLKGLS